MGSKVQPTGWWSSPGPPSSLRSGWPNVLGTCQLLSWSPGVGPEMHVSHCRETRPSFESGHLAVHST